MIFRILSGSVVALGLGLWTESARADQMFICDDGRMLQVKLADMERLKRSEPCVAAHFGITVKPMPLPVQRPRDFAAPPLKGAQAVEPAAREMGAMAAAQMDFRNVRIINAQPGGHGWFSHTR